VDTIVDIFSYPCQITSDAGEITVTTVGTREAWVPQIQRLVATHREIGVHTAEALELRAPRAALPSSSGSHLTPTRRDSAASWERANIFRRP
jgi:hypothetical protein